MNRQNITAAVVIVVIAATAYWILGKKDSKYLSPKKSDGKAVEEKTNARIALDAYLNAIDNGEDARSLEKLNSTLVQELGIRVVRSSGKWMARTSDGRDILMVK